MDGILERLNFAIDKTQRLTRGAANTEKVSVSVLRLIRLEKILREAAQVISELKQRLAIIEIANKIVNVGVPKPERESGMERLTNKDRYGHYYTNEKINDRMQANEPFPHAYDGKTIDKLGQYEDSEESATLFRLPCKIGDIVWQLNRYNANITPKVVSQIVHTISKSGESVEIWFETAGRCRGSDFGKTVFCDKAEAMQAFTKYSSEGDT